MIVIDKIEAEDTYSIRKTVLRQGMTLSFKMNGDHDKETLHLGLFENDELVCIGSFMKATKDIFRGKQYQLRGMASAGDAQGKGYGKLLLEEAESILKENGITTIWCNARTVALNFYSKLGYQTVGGEFEVAEVGPHYLMFKVIT